MFLLQRYWVVDSFINQIREEHLDRKKSDRDLPD